MAARPQPQVTEEAVDDTEGEELPVELLAGYVVSIVGRRRFRRLHHMARCGTLPGTDHKEFNFFGETLPPPTEYDGVCSRCWRHREVFEQEAGGAAEGLASASSSGESSAESALPDSWLVVVVQDF